MRVHLIVISFVSFTAMANANITTSTEPWHGAKYSNSSATTPIFLFESGTLLEVFTERFSDENTYLIGQSPAQEEILEIPTDRDGGKKGETSPAYQPANDKVLDIPTDRDLGDMKGAPYSQQPANDKVLEVPTRRDLGDMKNAPPGQQPAEDKVLDIPTDRDSSKQKQKKIEEQPVEIKPEDEVTPAEVIPAEGIH